MVPTFFKSNIIVKYNDFIYIVFFIFVLVFKWNDSEHSQTLTLLIIYRMVTVVVFAYRDINWVFHQFIVTRIFVVLWCRSHETSLLNMSSFRHTNASFFMAVIIFISVTYHQWFSYLNLKFKWWVISVLEIDFDDRLFLNKYAIS